MNSLKLKKEIDKNIKNEWKININNKNESLLKSWNNNNNTQIYKRYIYRKKFI